MPFYKGANRSQTETAKNDMRELRRKCSRSYSHQRNFFKNTPTDATWKLKSDQKPLESILKKSLAFAPKRLQNMIMRRYDYEVQYKRVKKLFLADTLSRAYLPNTVHPTAAEFEKINAAAFLPVSTSRLREIQKQSKYHNQHARVTCPQLKKVMLFVRSRCSWGVRSGRYSRIKEEIQNVSLG